MIFTVQCTNDKIWNLVELIGFLNAHQHKDIELSINPEAICLESLGLYKILDQFTFKKVTIHTFNFLETHRYYNINILPSNFLPSQLQNIPSNYWSWTQSKIFLVMFGRPTANRLGLASYLFHHHKEKSHIHFSGGSSPDNLSLFELDKLLTYRVSSIDEVGKFLMHMPLKVHDTSGYTKTNYNYDDILTSMYGDALVDIVSEPHVLGNTFFATEKTFRPMWCKRPFITFASADYLAYLRQMGFRTFSDFWSEDYDGYEGGDRLKRIFKLIDQLAAMTSSELEKMYWDMQYSLEHNYQLLQSQSYNLELSKLPYDG